MMPFLAVRCLNCNNVDELPRLDYDEIPYCSQCASTSNLVPATPPKAHPQPQQWTPDDLTALFSRTTLSAPAPTAPAPTANFSVSQHYTHPTTLPQSAPPPRPDERAYIQYLLSANLGSDTSAGDLQIALAHGIVTRAEYDRAVNANNALREQKARDERVRALEEECSALRLLRAAKKEKDPVFRTAEFFNDYYGGVDSAWEDEEAPCVVHGPRLRPFDL